MEETGKDIQPYEVCFIFKFKTSPNPISIFSFWLSPGHGTKQDETINTALLTEVMHVLLMFDCIDNE